MNYYIILGKDTGIQNSIPNMYRYSFTDSINESENKTIYERKYLDEYYQSIAYKHLAEYSAWYVFAKYNPINLLDDDIVSFISGEKFTERTHILISDLNKFSYTLKEILDDYSVCYFYTYPERDITKTYPEDWFWNHINKRYWQTIAIKNKLRTKYDNLPNINCNYISCKYKQLKMFVEWIENNLFNHFFEIDTWKKIGNNIDIAGECNAANHPAYADRYRVFGMIIEFFAYKYFQTCAKQYIADHNGWIYRITYDRKLNHKVHKAAYIY
jgi:hypothetical protein